MKSTLVLLLSMSLLGLAASSPTDNPMVGKWDCVSKDVSSPEIHWTLVVADTDGKLSGSLIADSGDQIPLLEPKLDGDTFTFRIDVNPSCVVQAKVKVTGKKFDGSFGCAEASGSLKGTKQS
jgi:hypothetical protein